MLVDNAAVQQLDARCGPRRQLRGVGDEDDGLAMLRQPGQYIEDVMGRARVEVAGRLVGDEQGRVVGQRPGDRDPLLLSAGDLRG